MTFTKGGSTLEQEAIAFPQNSALPPNLETVFDELIYRFKKDHSVAFEIRENEFPVEATPGLGWGNSRGSPNTLSAGEGKLPPVAYPTHSAPWVARSSHLQVRAHTILRFVSRI